MADTMKKLAAGLLAACALCLVLAPGIAWGAAEPGVKLDAGENGGNVAVGLALPDGMDQVGALKLTLAVTGVDAVDVEFAFSEAPDAEVREVRVQKADDGVQRVNLYVASKGGSLFAGKGGAEGGTLGLGSLVLSSEGGASAWVRVEGFEAVNTAHVALEAAELGLGMPEPIEVQATAGGTTPNPPVPPSGGDGGDGDGSDTGTGSGDGSGSGGSGPITNLGDDPDAGANTSPGAPSGTDRSLMATGDASAAPIAVAAVIAIAVAAAAAFGFACRSRQR